MSSYLLYGNFKWLKNVDGFDVNSIRKKISIEYIFKVDLKYPDKLHVLHNDYPLDPEKLAVSDMLSDNCKKTADEYEIKFGDENVRLVNNKKDFLKFTSRPTHITHKIFAKNYVAIHEIKPALTLSKLIYATFTVLESSK